MFWMEGFKLAVSMAKDLLKSYVDSKYIYHNYNHTLNVVNAAEIIGTHSQLSEKEINLLLLSAWFHDTGYCNSPVNHEQNSANIAKKVLSTLDFQIETIATVMDAILSTAMPQRPKTEIAKCLCDADLYHLSQPNFEQTSDLLRQEISIISGQQYSESDWHERNCEFMKAHQYHTSYGQIELEPRKTSNLQNLILSSV